MSFTQAVQDLGKHVGRFSADVRKTLLGPARSALSASSTLRLDPGVAQGFGQVVDFSKGLQAQAVKEAVRRYVARGGSPMAHLGGVIDERLAAAHVMGGDNTYDKLVMGATAAGGLSEVGKRNAALGFGAKGEVRPFNVNATSLAELQNTFDTVSEMVKQVGDTKASTRGLVQAEQDLAKLQEILDKVKKTGVSHGVEMGNVEKLAKGLETWAMATHSATVFPTKGPKTLLQKVRDFFTPQGANANVGLMQRLQNAQPGAAMMAGGAGWAASVANPVAFATLTGSMQLLGQAIGTGLTPLVISLSQYLQEFAQVIHDMNPTLKKWAVGSVGATAAVATGALAFGTILSSLKQLGLTGLGLIGYGIAHPAVGVPVATLATVYGAHKALSSAVSDETMTGMSSSGYGHQMLSQVRKSPAYQKAVTDEQKTKDRGTLDSLLVAWNAIKIKPEFSDLEGAYQRIQIRALETDPLQQLQLKWHLEDLQAMIELLSEQKTTNEELRRAVELLKR